MACCLLAVRAGGERPLEGMGMGWLNVLGSSPGVSVSVYSRAEQRAAPMRCYLMVAGRSDQLRLLHAD